MKTLQINQKKMTEEQEIKSHTQGYTQGHFKSLLHEYREP